MDNPEVRLHTIDTATLYQYQKGTNIPWIINQYRAPRLEINADLEIKKRMWLTQKKGDKVSNYVTKRGFYMNQILKQSKLVPSPQVYSTKNEWDFQKAKSQSRRHKIDASLKKNTYLDKIQIEQKKRKIPGVCHYNIQKSLKQVEQEKKKKNRKAPSSERLFYYQNTEMLSNGVPGAGNYCVNHQSKTQSIKKNPEENKINYKYWIQKHKNIEQKIQKIQQLRPSSFTYNPMNTSLQTFDQLALSSKKIQKIKTFGTDTKFQYTRPVKRMKFEQRPDPSSYRTSIQWKGKSVSPKHQNWNDFVWKGHSKSVYH